MKISVILLVSYFIATTQGLTQNWWLEINYDSTNGTFLDARDNITYKWVKIGEQIWMAENLRATQNCNGDTIFFITNGEDWGRPILVDSANRIKKTFPRDLVGISWRSPDRGIMHPSEYTIYKNKAFNDKIYGKLYNWYAISDRSFCPDGFHIPTHDEWDLLIKTMGGDDNAVKKLKSTEYWPYELQGVDAVGFSLMPSGVIFDNGEFEYLNESGFYWSLNPGDLYGEVSLIHFDDRYSAWIGEIKYYGAACRCLKDEVKSIPNQKSINYQNPINDIDGNVYKTVKINEQTWLAENLRVTKYNDGSPIPLILSDSTWKNIASDGYCWYDNDSINYASVYGCLYNWYTANSNKLCPKGYHVPTSNEWSTLDNYLWDQEEYKKYGATKGSGAKLKAEGIKYWHSPNGGATDEFGFSALPGGSRTASEGKFYGIGLEGGWWESAPESGTMAGHRGISYDTENISYGLSSINYGHSVRCIKDD